jgi:archaellum biogenesis ATPase FlaH
MNTTEKILKKINDPFDIRNEDTAIVDAYKQSLKRKPSDIISYGFEWLDDKLVGIDIAELVLVGSETGGGKTTFMRSVAYASALQGKKAMYFLLEDNLIRTKENDMYLQVNQYRVAQGGKAYPYQAFVKGELDKKQLEAEFAEVIKTKPKDYVNNLTWVNAKNTVSPEDILNKIKEEKDNYDIFFIDHLHYIEFPPGQQLQIEIQKFMVGLASLVRNYGLRIMMSAHYKKLGKDRPTDESFKDAQAIPHNATTTIHIYRDKTEDIEVEPVETDEGTIIDKEDITTFYIQKVRNLFASGNIKATFNKQTGTYDGYTDWNAGGKANNEPKQLF